MSDIGNIEQISTAELVIAQCNAGIIGAMPALNPRSTAALDEDVARIRKLWPRNFVIKGIMHPDDARRAVQLGVDGIVVSNHGGRQLDRAPSPLEVFPGIKQAVGDMETARGRKVALMLDSGIRRGADILTALALGADFCWVGRWTLFGAVAGGQAGATHAVSMIRTDMEQVLRQMGCRDVAELGPEWLMDDAAKAGRNW